MHQPLTDCLDTWSALLWSLSGPVEVNLWNYRNYDFQLTFCRSQTQIWWVTHCIAKSSSPSICALLIPATVERFGKMSSSVVFCSVADGQTIKMLQRIRWSCSPQPIPTTQHYQPIHWATTTTTLRIVSADLLGVSGPNTTPDLSPGRTMNRWEWVSFKKSQ